MLIRKYEYSPKFAFVALVLATAANAETYELKDGQAVAPFELFQECDVCPEMIVLPKGNFTMGAPLHESADLDFLLMRELKRGERPGLPQEGPEHVVEIDIPIAMGRNEVTYEEWMMCVADGGCDHVPDPTILTREGDIVVNIVIKGRSPVRNVSYFDMLTYIQWLNETVGVDAYRLPTEAEWEYAARAGTSTPFAQGNTLTTDQANIIGFSEPRDEDSPQDRATGRGVPISVDELDAANAWGLRHMSGNVAEFTMSCRSDRHLGLGTSSAYLADALNAPECRRVTKGGAFSGAARLARPAVRGSGSERSRTDIAGFRLVRELQ